MDKKRDLAAAKLRKRDEFYTQLTDIEKQLFHYRNHFKDKTVLCNCDDPFESNFFKYFVLNFNRLKLKKVMATCYFSSPIAGEQLHYTVGIDGQMSISFGDEEVQLNSSKRPYKAIVTQVYDKTGDGGVDMLDIAELFKSGDNELKELESDGDFRSQECLDLLDESDIVVTNPPFSLFREYIDILMQHEKQFVIIGPQNAISYKEIFPLIVQNKLWLGYPFDNGNAYFHIPNNADISQYASGVYDPETKRVHFRNCCWFTNLDIRKRHEELVLVKRYSAENYPKYENFDAINVDRVVDIPCDYDGIMGVPITFMDKYSPDQFEIIGLGITDLGKSIGVGDYDRAYKTPASRDGTLYYVKDGKGVVPYARVLVRNKHPEQQKGGQQ